MSVNGEKESYYRILGTTAKIGQNRIKEKYMKALREHPPEKDPERFEQIREAYEVLKDPEKRQQYDLMRKYGGKIETMLNRAMKALNNDHVRKSQVILEEVLKIDPDNIGARLALFSIAGKEGWLDKAYDYVVEFKNDQAFFEESGVEMTMIYQMYTNMMLDLEEGERAVAFLEKVMDEIDVIPYSLVQSMGIACLMSGDVDRAVNAVKQAIPDLDDDQLDHMDAVMWQCLLISILGEVHWWSELTKASAALTKRLKQIDDPEEKEAVFFQLMNEVEIAEESERYRLADIFMDSAKRIALPDQDIKEKQKHLKRIAKVEKEMQKFIKDPDTYPMTLYYAVMWFYEGSGNGLLESLEETYGDGMLKELEEDEEMFAAAILYLKKKYPALYNMYKSDWDELYEELTEGMNREQRRELKKLM